MTINESFLTKNVRDFCQKKFERSTSTDIVEQ